MKRSCLLGAAYALCLSLMVSGAANASITYQVDREIGDGTVTGFIKTDGTLDVLSSENIEDWALTLSAVNLSSGPEYTIDFQNSSVSIIFGSAITATATQLQFDFSVAGDNYLLFQGPGPEDNNWCLETSGGCSGTGDIREVIGTSNQGPVAQSVFYNVTDKIVFAQVVPVPAAVWLFGSGLLGLVGIARRKKSAIQY